MLRGVGCSVLCRDNIVPTVKDYLSEVAQDLLRPVSHSLLPNGWSMFRDVSARVHVEAPAGLDALEVAPNIELIVSGGLRLGRTWSWLTGAPAANLRVRDGVPRPHNRERRFGGGRREWGVAGRRGLPSTR